MDGFKNLIMRYHCKEKPFKAINLKCVTNWPMPGFIKLKVMSSLGDDISVIISTPAEFTFRLEVENTGVAGSQTWVI
jgi:hypothetical protein